MASSGPDGPAAPKPSGSPIAPTAPAAATPSPADDAGYAAWLRAVPPETLRAEVEGMARGIAGVGIDTWNCSERPCQTNVNADGPTSFDALLRQIHHRYHGHVAFIASVDAPGAPNRVMGSIMIGTLERNDDDTLGRAP